MVAVARRPGLAVFQVARLESARVPLEALRKLTRTKLSRFDELLAQSRGRGVFLGGCVPVPAPVVSGFSLTLSFWFWALGCS